MTTKKTNKRFIRHEQWIEIMRVNGKTVTLFYPPNEEFEKLRLQMDPPPHMIYRRLNFIHGVPPEYEWTSPTPDIRRFGGHYLQRITLEEWPVLFKAELLEGNRRVIPALNAQPRPPELGPCPCALCTQERMLTPGKSRYDKS
jgi:hypothetical protein